MAKKRRSPEEWADLINEQQESGETRSQWCGKRGINYNSFKNALYQKSKAEEKTPSECDWVQVTPPIKETLNDNHPPIGQLCIKIGAIHITADGEYPPGKLAKLCQELVRSC